MEDNIKFELISALMDDELTSEKDLKQAVSLLLNDVDCQRKWEEYHLIGTGLQQSLSNHPTTRIFSIKGDCKRSYQVFKIGFSLAASVSLLAIGIALFWKQHSSFIAENDVMLSSLAAGNFKVAVLTFMSEDNFNGVVDDVEYAKAQRSLDNHFLLTHGNSGNTGGIVRVAFPSRMKEQVK